MCVGPNYWVGLSDVVTEGEFIWNATNMAANYTAWGCSQPDNYEGNEDCVVISLYADGTFRWHDYPCYKQQYAICELLP